MFVLRRGGDRVRLLWNIYREQEMDVVQSHRGGSALLYEGAWEPGSAEISNVPEEE